LQEFQDFEIIVVDAFSIDGSHELLVSEPKVKLLQIESDATFAFITAINEAVGKYIMFATTSDFLPISYWLNTAITELESDSELSMVWSSGFDISQNKNVVSIYGEKYLFCPPPEKKKYLPYSFFRLHFPELNYVMRRRVMLECIYSSNYENHKTFGLIDHINLSFVTLGYLQKYIPSFGHVGRQHSDSVTKANEKHKIQYFIRICRSKLFFFMDIMTGRTKFFFRNSEGEILSGIAGFNKIKLPIIVLVLLMLEIIHKTIYEMLYFSWKMGNILSIWLAEKS
jgi:glycosyltransferase involved in cell wall biosynthesis